MTTTLDALRKLVKKEPSVAERYRWWGVYLIYEKRRLQAIAEAVGPVASDDAQTQPSAEADPTEDT